MSHVFCVPGHMYFTQLLLPALLLGAKSSPDGKARVVNTSSSGHLFGSLDFNTLKGGPGRNKHSSSFFYLQSKLVSLGFRLFLLALVSRLYSQRIRGTSFLRMN